jgi:NAD(P)-dependent dehydrogenase (short-subunit alcohol dehydrogenase family)
MFDLSFFYVGIGLATSQELAKKNARVILACRSMGRGEEARKAIMDSTGNTNVVVRELDLSSLKSVRKFAERINKEEDKVHILVNNAGVVGKPHMCTMVII